MTDRDGSSCSLAQTSKREAEGNRDGQVNRKDRDVTPPWQDKKRTKQGITDKDGAQWSALRQEKDQYNFFFGLLRQEKDQYSFFGLTASCYYAADSPTAK